MPLLEDTDCNQAAVRWPRAGSDEYDQTLYGPGEPVWVRWVQTSGGRSSPTGDERTVDVDLACTTALGIGDLLWRGRYDDLPGTSEPVPTSDVYEVVRDKSAVDLTGKYARYEYDLALHGRTLGVPAPAEDL